MGKEEETRTISARVSLETYENVKKLVKEGHYLNIGDYLRSLIRADLKSKFIIE